MQSKLKSLDVFHPKQGQQLNVGKASTLIEKKKYGLNWRECLSKVLYRDQPAVAAAACRGEDDNSKT